MNHPSLDSDLPAFRLGSTPPSAAELAIAAARPDHTDWSAVLGGTVRLAGDEWQPTHDGNWLVDLGGNWLLVVPVSPVPGPFRPGSEGLLGPVPAGRAALAAWLLLASVGASELPDVLLVAERAGAEAPEVGLSGRISPRPLWPRPYHYAAGFFGPAGSYSAGNADFAAATGLDEVGGAPGWLERLQLPCAVAALGEPNGAGEATLSWVDLGATAHRLATLAQSLDGALWPRGETAAVPAWELQDLTPEAERGEQGAESAAARRKLPGWMADAPTAGGNPGLLRDAQGWDPTA